MRNIQHSCVTFLIPTYDDWESLEFLIPCIEKNLRHISERIRIVLVNDGSSMPIPKNFKELLDASVTDCLLINLTRNLGHQRAIAIGLAYINKNIEEHGPICVMDADGEDNPADIPKLLEMLKSGNNLGIVFAERTRRSESAVFQLGYFCYKILHRIMTGRKIRFGNFSVIPRCEVKKIVTISELWNHYAAAVVIARFPVKLVPTTRAARLAGKTRMNYASLILHGLKAISVYAEDIGVRALVFTGIFLPSSCVLLVVLLFSPKIFNWSAPLGLIIAMAVFCVSQVFFLVFVFQFTLLVLQGRSFSNFIPARDYKYYIVSIEN